MCHRAGEDKSFKKQLNRRRHLLAAGHTFCYYNLNKTVIEIKIKGENYKGGRCLEFIILVMKNNKCGIYCELKMKTMNSET